MINKISNWMIGIALASAGPLMIAVGADAVSSDALGGAAALGLLGIAGSLLSGGGQIIYHD